LQKGSQDTSATKGLTAAHLQDHL